MRFDSLLVDDEILDKIESKHGVLVDEADEVFYSSRSHLRRGRAGLYELLGPTEAGRLLLVVIADRGFGEWQLVTARSMTDAERRLYRRRIGE
jgi:uncharacterized DUF497 family protein